MDLYAKSPVSAALAGMLGDKHVTAAYIGGAVASSVPVLFASVARTVGGIYLFVLDNAEEAGYFTMILRRCWVTLMCCFSPRRTAVR